MCVLAQVHTGSVRQGAHAYVHTRARARNTHTHTHTHTHTRTHTYTQTPTYTKCVHTPHIDAHVQIHTCTQRSTSIRRSRAQTCCTTLNTQHTRTWRSDSGSRWCGVHLIRRDTSAGCRVVRMIDSLGGGDTAVALLFAEVLDIIPWAHLVGGLLGSVAGLCDGGCEVFL
jgi:hypothetical protein